MATAFARAVTPKNPTPTLVSTSALDHTKPTTPPADNTAEQLAIALQYRAENALSMALHYTRHGNTAVALAKARRAIAALSQAATAGGAV